MKMSTMLWSLMGCLLTMPCFSQVPVVRSFEEGVRVGAEAYIQANARLGAEASRALSSCIGQTPDYTWRVKMGQTANTVLPTFLFEKLVAARVVESAFPGYIVSFPKMWDQAYATHRFSLENWETILEGAYGYERLFRGDFVPSLREVAQLASEPFGLGVPPNIALRQAYEKGKKVKSGFFVIVVQGEQNTVFDVLILDTKTNLWLSWKQSQLAAQQPASASN